MDNAFNLKCRQNCFQILSDESTIKLVVYLEGRFKLGSKTNADNEDDKQELASVIHQSIFGELHHAYIF